MAHAKTPLLSVLYHSAETPGSSSFDLDELITESRTRNRISGVTGMLLAENGRFVQALEGPPEAVRALMASIAADPRHEHVRVLAEEEIPERRFPDWAMARGHVGEIEATPLAGHVAALLSARDELPAAPSVTDRIRAWFRA